DRFSPSNRRLPPAPSDEGVPERLLPLLPGLDPRGLPDDGPQGRYAPDPAGSPRPSDTPTEGETSLAQATLVPLAILLAVAAFEQTAKHRRRNRRETDRLASTGTRREHRR